MPFNNTTFLDIQFQNFRQKGFKNFFYIIGHGGDEIDKALKELSRTYQDIKITSLDEGNQRLGTGGAIKKVINKLPDSFYLTYGDNYLLFDKKELDQKISLMKKENLLVIFKNNNKYDASNIVYDPLQKKIISYKESSGIEMKYIDYGISYWNKNFIQKSLPNKSIFEFSHFICTSIAENNLDNYEVFERFYEIGTPSSYNEFQKYYEEEIQ